MKYVMLLALIIPTFGCEKTSHLKDCAEASVAFAMASDKMANASVPGVASTWQDAAVASQKWKNEACTK